MNRLRKAVQETIVTEGLFTRKDPLLIAFSGGSDSVALVRLLLSLGYNQCQLVYIDHGLRSENELSKERSFIQSFAATFNLPLRIKKLPVLFCMKTYGVSAEMAGHILRKHYIQHLASLRSAKTILYAHHYDDVLETCVLQLKRNSVYHMGLPIKSCHQKIPVTRPLLRVTKKQLLRYLKTENQSYSTDTSNQSQAYERNTIRHHVLPVLNNISPTIAESINTLLQRVQSSYQAIPSMLIKTPICIIEEYAYSRCDCSMLRMLDPHTAASVVYKLLKTFHAIRYSNGLKAQFSHPFQVSSKQIDRLTALIQSKSNGQTLQISKHVKCMISKNILYLDHMHDDGSHCMKLNHLKPTQAFGYNITISICDQLPNNLASNTQSCYVSLKTGQLIVRRLRKGDQFIPFSRDKYVDPLNYLAKKQVPFLARHYSLVFLEDDNVVWIPEGGVSERYKIRNYSEIIYKIEIRPLTNPVTHMLSYT